MDDLVQTGIGPLFLWVDATENLFGNISYYSITLI